MTTVKISQLPAITGANTATTDVLPIVDVSGNITNKITREEFFKNIQSDIEIADKIVHSGDTNTSIRFPAADTVTVETSGAERLRITSAGNVGIGTSSPTAKLHVESASGSGGRVLFGGSTTSGYSTNINVTDNGMEFWAQSNARGFTFSTGTTQTERMRITSAGNVGIGTNSPVVALDVNGDVELSGVVYKNQPAQTSKAAAATLTIAELLTGIIQYTGAVATLTLPTGTLIEGGTPASFPTNMSFDFSVINTGLGVATLGTATGLTLVGAMTVAAGASGLFRVRKTATNTYTVYRIS